MTNVKKDGNSLTLQYDHSRSLFSDSGQMTPQEGKQDPSIPFSSSYHGIEFNYTPPLRLLDNHLRFNIFGGFQFGTETSAAMPGLPPAEETEAEEQPTQTCDPGQNCEVNPEDTGFAGLPYTAVYDGTRVKAGVGIEGSALDDKIFAGLDLFAFHDSGTYNNIPMPIADKTWPNYQRAGDASGLGAGLRLRAGTRLIPLIHNETFAISASLEAYIQGLSVTREVHYQPIPTLNVGDSVTKVGISDTQWGLKLGGTWDFGGTKSTTIASGVSVSPPPVTTPPPPKPPITVTAVPVDAAIEACKPCDSKAADLKPELDKYLAIFFDGDVLKKDAREDFESMFESITKASYVLETIQLEIAPVSAEYENGTAPQEPIEKIVITAINPKTGRREIIMDRTQPGKLIPLTPAKAQELRDKHKEMEILAEAKAAQRSTFNVGLYQFKAGQPMSKPAPGKVTLDTLMDPKVTTLAGFEALLEKAMEDAPLDTATGKKGFELLQENIKNTIKELNKPESKDDKFYMHATASREDTDANNLELSIRRAQVLSRWLELAGFDKTRILGIVGTGEDSEFLAKRDQSDIKPAPGTSAYKKWLETATPNRAVYMVAAENLPDGGMNPKMTLAEKQKYIADNAKILRENLENSYEIESVKPGKSAVVKRRNPVDFRDTAVFGYLDVQQANTAGIKSCAPQVVDVTASFMDLDGKTYTAITPNPTQIAMKSCSLFPKLAKPAGTKKTYKDDYEAPLKEIRDRMTAIEKHMSDLKADVATITEDDLHKMLGKAISMVAELKTFSSKLAALKEASGKEADATFKDRVPAAAAAEGTELLKHAGFSKELDQAIEDLSKLLQPTSALMTKEALWKKTYAAVQSAKVEFKVVSEGTIEVTLRAGEVPIAITGKLPPYIRIKKPSGVFETVVIDPTFDLKIKATKGLRVDGSTLQLLYKGNNGEYSPYYVYDHEGTLVGDFKLKINAPAPARRPARPTTTTAVRRTARPGTPVAPVPASPPAPAAPASGRSRGR